MEKDKRFHIDKCSAQADNELNEDNDDDNEERDEAKQNLAASPSDRTFIMYFSPSWPPILCFSLRRESL